MEESVGQDRNKQSSMDPLSDPMHLLSDAWHTLRMSVQHPSRVRTWDAIVLTAASPDQAKLYQLQLERAKQVGVIARATIILAVPDPGSQRIGSGAATLHAIRSLSSHIASNRNASEVHSHTEGCGLFDP